jgi:hypothetical protein
LTHKQYVWFRGGNLNSFRDIIGSSCFSGIGPPRMAMTYISSVVPWHKNQGYVCLELGISTMFGIFVHFLFKGDGTTLCGHDLHTIICSLTQEARKHVCMISRWGSQQVSSHSVRELHVSGGKVPPVWS